MSKKTKNILIIVFVVAVLVLFGEDIKEAIEEKIAPTHQLTEETLEASLEDCSDLVTEELYYKGYVTYEDGHIPIISKQSFAVVFEATVPASIDVSEIDIDVESEEKKVIVILPDATIGNVTLDTVQIVDEHWALFNNGDADDLLNAQAGAKNAALEYAKQSDLLDRANERAKIIIENLFTPITEEAGYELIVK